VEVVFSLRLCGSCMLPGAIFAPILFMGGVAIVGFDPACFIAVHRLYSARAKAGSCITAFGCVLGLICSVKSLRYHD